jgi:chromosomal replication initiator protein
VNGVLSIPFAGWTADPEFRPAAERQRAPNLCEFVVGPENRYVPFAVEKLFQTAPLALQPPDNFDIRFPESGDTSAREPLGNPCSPLVFHGPPGTGKSHLAFGIADQWRSHHQGSSVVYVTAADYARQFHDAIESRTVEAWRASYRSVALLVLEDLGQLSTKTAAQIELIQTLDALADRQSHVVVTSRQALDQISSLAPGLRSRLEAGLVIGLNLPSIATRRVLLERLSRQRNTLLAEPALTMLSEQLSVSVPELFGALLYLETAAILEESQIDAARVQEYLSRRVVAAAPSLRGIAAHTARHFCLDIAELKSPSRRRAVVVARGVAMYLARQLTGKSLEQIGDYFGGRDHTTVLHGCRKTEELMKTDSNTRKAVSHLHQKLAGE